MAPLLNSASTHPQAFGLARFVVVALIAIAVVIAASVAFGWTLTAGPAFELTPNPGADLPF